MVRNPRRPAQRAPQRRAAAGPQAAVQQLWEPDCSHRASMHERLAEAKAHWQAQRRQRVIRREAVHPVWHAQAPRRGLSISGCRAKPRLRQEPAKLRAPKQGPTTAWVQQAQRAQAPAGRQRHPTQAG